MRKVCVLSLVSVILLSLFVLTRRRLLVKECRLTKCSDIRVISPLPPPPPPHTQRTYMYVILSGCSVDVDEVPYLSLPSVRGPFCPLRLSISAFIFRVELRVQHRVFCPLWKGRVGGKKSKKRQKHCRATSHGVEPDRVSECCFLPSSRPLTASWCVSPRLQTGF